jgi:hypothetical protein
MSGITKREQINRKIGEAVTKRTPETIKKLEDAFAIDATIEEACFYADITPPTYYSWVKKDPELLKRFEALRNQPVLKARQTIVKGLDQIPVAQWYIGRKRPVEFADTTKVQHSGSVATGEGGGVELADAEKKIREEYEEKLREAIVTSNVVAGKKSNENSK